MIEAFRQWFLEHRLVLAPDGISLELSKGSEGLPKNGVYAVLKSDRFEAGVELWETGESEFYFSDWEAAERDPAVGVVVTHHDFTSPAELYTALDELVNRMSLVLV